MKIYLEEDEFRYWGFMHMKALDIWGFRTRILGYIMAGSLMRRAIQQLIPH